MARTAIEYHPTNPGDKEITSAFETLIWVSKAYQRLHPQRDIHTFSPRDDQHTISDLTKFSVQESKDRGLWDRKSMLERASYIMTSINKLITQTKDKDPIPSSPTRQPVINVTATTLTDNRRFNAAFAAISGAYRLITWMISDRQVKWLDDNTIVINDKVKVTTDAKPSGLSEILEYELSPREALWELPQIYMKYSHSLFIDKEPDWTDRLVTDPPSRKTTSADSKPTKPTKPKPAKPTGLIDLPTLLKDTDIEPKEARQALRKSNQTKPAHGRWEFTEEEAPSVLKVITTTVAKLRKK